MYPSLFHIYFVMKLLHELQNGVSMTHYGNPMRYDCSTRETRIFTKQKAEFECWIETWKNELWKFSSVTKIVKKNFHVAAKKV